MSYPDYHIQHEVYYILYWIVKYIDINNQDFVLGKWRKGEGGGGLWIYQRIGTE